MGFCPQAWKVRVMTAINSTRAGWSDNESQKEDEGLQGGAEKANCIVRAFN